MLRLSRCCAAIVLVPLLAACTATAQDPWLGQRVFCKDGAVAKVGNVQVDWKLIPFPATVGEVNGEWLWLVRAWVRKSDVMTVEQALDYFTERIRANPNDDFTYDKRGGVWKEKGELDNAIKDYTEAIRLDPRDAVTYSNRGNAWSDKGELDNAIKDYTEAIRLDPKNAAPYSNRGNAWRAKGELDNAIKDCTEAIRLDPKYATAYSNRGFAYHTQQDYEAALRDYDTAIRLNPKYVIALGNKSFLLSTTPQEDLRDPEQALSFAEKALAINATSAYAMAAKACAMALAGDYEQAIELQRRALENKAYAEDNGIDGGAHAPARIAAWEKGKLWLDRPTAAEAK